MGSWFGMALFLQLFTTSFTLDVSVIWRKVNTSDSLTVGFNNRFPASNTASCVFGCFTTGDMPMAALVEGHCICFKLNKDISSNTVTIFTYYIKTSDPSTCVSKGYTVFTGLGCCIKYYGSRLGSFKAFQQVCNQDGGYLMQMNTQHKMNMAMSLVVGDSALVYIGAFTHVLGQDFQQTRGGLLDLNLFVSGEPSSDADDYCVGISKVSGVVRGAADINCYWPISFFCELVL